MRIFLQISFTLLYFCTFSIVNAQETIIKALKLNSVADDFAPTFYKEDLVFSSNRKNSVVKNYWQYDKEGDEQNLTNLFHISFNEDSSKIKYLNTFKSLNKANIHNGPSSFSANFDTIYFVQTQEVKQKNSKKTLGIYFSVYQDSLWTSPIGLPINSESYNVSHPCLSQDGKTLFFVSEMPDGMGGMDIWFIQKTRNQTWSKPQNLGAHINSQYDEVFPYFSSKNVLYFSSNRPNSLGGYDIFYTSWPEISKIKTFKQPLNSYFDDFAFITLNNGKTGFFTSNRDEKNNDNIYAFENKVSFDSCIKSASPKFCYTFSEIEAYKNGPHIKSFWDFGDSKQSNETQPFHCFSSPGKKTITLSLLDTITGVLSENVAIYILDIIQPSDYYFKMEEDSLETSRTFEIYNFETNQKVTSSVIWKLDEEIFFDQDSLIIKKPITGEYQIKSFMTGLNQCIETISNVTPILTVDSKNKKIKLLANEQEELGISKFAFDMVTNEVLPLGNKFRLILSINKKDYLTKQEWIKHISYTFAKYFDKELFIDYHQNQDIYLYITHE